MRYTSRYWISRAIKPASALGLCRLGTRTPDTSGPAATAGHFSIATTSTNKPGKAASKAAMVGSPTSHSGLISPAGATTPSDLQPLVLREHGAPRPIVHLRLEGMPVLQCSGPLRGICRTAKASSPNNCGHPQDVRAPLRLRVVAIAGVGGLHSGPLRVDGLNASSPMARQLADSGPRISEDAIGGRQERSSTAPRLPGISARWS
jgi:hypothetical protein